MSDFVPGTVVEKPSTVIAGGGKIVSPCHGTVLVMSAEGNQTIECKSVLYIAECSKKLMPTSPFIQKGCSQWFGNFTEVGLTDPKGKVLFSGKEIGGLYFFECKTIRTATHVSNSSAESLTCQDIPLSFFGLSAGNRHNITAPDFPRRLLEAHWAYGHLAFPSLRKLLHLKPGPSPDCVACNMAKSRETQLSKQKHDRSIEPIHRFHLDLGFTKDKRFCFQLAVDDCTRKSFLVVLKSSGDALDEWRTLKKQMEKEFWPRKVAIVRTDGESVYTSKDWDEHIDNEDLKHEVSGRYRHDQNGVVERAMQTVGTAFRCMIIMSNAPEELIPFCLRHANVCRNHSTTSANDGKTPQKHYLACKLSPNKKLLQAPWGCLCFAHVYKEERAKHEPRGVPCVYLGWNDADNQYLVKDLVNGDIYFSVDVSFHPSSFPYRMSVEQKSQLFSQAPITTVPIAIAEISVQPASSRIQGYSQSIGTPLQSIPDKDVAPDNGLILMHQYGPDPTNWKEAMESPYSEEWIVARLKEQNSFKLHDVYEIVPRSEAILAGKRVFKPRPVYKVKMNPPTVDYPNGKLDKFKYRLTIQALTKLLKEGVDYEEKYASTVRWSSYLALIAIAVKYDYDIGLVAMRTRTTSRDLNLAGFP